MGDRMKYVVGYISFFDNYLILERIDAKNEHEAFWKHSKLQDDCWEISKKETKGMDSEELQAWSFDCDMLVSVLEI